MVSRFVIRKWIKVNALSGGKYSVIKNIRFKTPILRSGQRDYSDAHIIVKDKATVIDTADTKKRNKKLTFKNNAPLRSCISNFRNTFVDNAKDLNIVMLMYSPLEYSDNCSMTSRSLQNCYRYKVSDATNENDAANYRIIKNKTTKSKSFENDAANYRIIKNKTTKSKSFEYKTKLLGSTPANANRLDEDIVVSFKYLDKVWRCLDLPLINYERELDLS